MQGIDNMSVVLLEKNFHNEEAKVVSALVGDNTNKHKSSAR